MTVSIRNTLAYAQEGNTIRLAHFKVTGPKSLEIKVPLRGTIPVTKEGWVSLVRKVNQDFEDLEEENNG